MLIYYKINKEQFNKYLVIKIIFYCWFVKKKGDYLLFMIYEN